MVKEQILKDLKKVLIKLQIPFEQLSLEHPADPAFGDYATNVAMQTHHPDFANPVDWANQIVNTWRLVGLPDYLAKVEVVKPGFINLWLKKEILSTKLTEVLKRKDKYGSSLGGKGKTVVIDYSGPNVAKPFGIGHLRSTNIGQAIYNLYKFTGWRTVGVNHLGDWGTQFGKLIYQIKLKMKNSKLKIKDLTIEKLEKLYVDFHKKAKTNPEMEDQARFWFKKLEDKDPEARKIWQACVDLSLQEFDRVYRLLKVKIDYTLGESFYHRQVKKVIDEAQRKGITAESEGALIIPLTGFETPLMLLKGDEGTTYHARDLAAIKFRLEKWRPALMIYEVGADQKLHFQQLFSAVELLSWAKKTQFVHLAHGLIRWSGGKFSTRKGSTIHLAEVLKEAIRRAEKIISASATGRGLSKKEKEKVAQAAGIGAVKYSDLKQNPKTDIVFDWERIFSLEGDSGPYLQYTYVRCYSVLEKAKESNLAITNLGAVAPEIVRSKGREAEEVNLLRTIYRFPEVVEEAAKSFSPNLICNFLFDLAQKYNLFYNKQPILKSAKGVREGRLALTAATAQILKNGLTLLGIEVLERM